MRPPNKCAVLQAAWRLGAAPEHEVRWDGRGVEVRRRRGRARRRIGVTIHDGRARRRIGVTIHD